MAASGHSGSSMAASDSRSRSWDGEHSQILCYHKDLAPLRTVRVEGPTFGKRFYGCSHWPRTCGFFKWADEFDQVQQLQFALFERDTCIAEMELKKEDLERKLKKVTEKNDALQEQNDELSIGFNEMLLALQNVRHVKLLGLAMIISWMFFGIVVLYKLM